MDVTFYELAPRDPQRKNRGRRYFTLRPRRILSVNANTIAQALEFAQASALSGEMAVGIGETIVLTVDGKNDRIATDCIYQHNNGKHGYVELPEQIRTVYVNLPGIGKISAGAMDWLAIPPGAVCRIHGQTYQWDGQNLMPVNLGG